MLSWAMQWTNDTLVRILYPIGWNVCSLTIRGHMLRMMLAKHINIEARNRLAEIELGKPATDGKTAEAAFDRRDEGMT